MGNVNQLFPSKWLKCSDLQGHRVVVTISRLSREELMPGEPAKPVLYFDGKEKGLVLNRTNANLIADAVGTAETDDWSGQRVALVPSRTQFKGEMVDCIRVEAAVLPKLPDGDGAVPF